jgi:hypothetical protein
MGTVIIFLSFINTHKLFSSRGAALFYRLSWTVKLLLVLKFEAKRLCSMIFFLTSKSSEFKLQIVSAISVS